MRGYKPYSPDDERFEIIYKEMRTEEAYADLVLSSDPDPVVAGEPAEVEAETDEEAVEAPETDWEDVTEDFHIEDVAVAEKPAESVSGDVEPADDANDGSDEGFDNPDRAEIDLELHETVAEETTATNENSEETAAEEDFNEPAWEEDEAGVVETNTADGEVVEEEDGDADTASGEDDAGIVAAAEIEDSLALEELVRQRLANDHTMPLEVLIKELGFEGQISLDNELNTSIDDSLDDDEETSMELDLSFVEEDEENEK